MIYTIVHGYISLVSSNIVASHRASITDDDDDDDVDTVYDVVLSMLYKIKIYINSDIMLNPNENDNDNNNDNHDNIDTYYTRFDWYYIELKLDDVISPRSYHCKQHTL